MYIRGAMNTQELAKSAVKSVKDYVSKRLEPLISKLSEAEADIAILKERPLPEKGEKGDQGEPGAAGEKGEAGTVDMAVVKSIIKDLVSEIPPAQDGRDGLDALDIQILPAINDLKSYPRGVYASHNGGLWKTFKQTEGMDGWECIIDGVADVHIEYDGERAFQISLSKSSGICVKKDFSLPMLIDRGVYKEGQEYKKFDGVTFGGSFWISQKDNPQGKPGEANSDFRLAVKRGRNATDTAKVGK